MRNTKRNALVVSGLVVLLGGGYLVVGAGFWNRGLPEGLIQTNGRIEGDHITIASKFPGRIQQLLVREGDTVTAGQVMVRLDDVQIR
ncbi:MAG: biotin/lipoyl-binding protein, partial [Nitrospiraceae bacterium]